MRRTVGLCVVLLIAAARFESKGQTSEVVTTNVDVKTSNSYPSPDRPTVQSCEVPIDAETKLPPDPYDQFAFFDAYSWQSFAALICNAQLGSRGLSTSTVGRANNGKRVFETFKSDWELYHPGHAAEVWNAYADEAYNPCGLDATPGDLVLAPIDKNSDTVQQQAGEMGSLLPPLPAQNHTYVRYLTQFNEKSFQHIRKVLAKDPHEPTEFPTGSVNVKSAWVEITGGLNGDNFHTVDGWIPSSDGHCRKTSFGLVGLHIAQKTPSRKRWIWSTFEHIWNAPLFDPQCKAQEGPSVYTFNDQKCLPMPDKPQYENQPDSPPKTVFNVVRYKNSSQAATDANKQYEKLLPGVWKNYELVMTQWPLTEQGSGAGPKATFFPDSTNSTAFANASMETFFQRFNDSTCMGCHEQTPSTDSAWSLGMVSSRRKLLEQAGRPVH